MFIFAAADGGGSGKVEQTITQSKDLFERLHDSYFNSGSLLTLASLLILAFILGRVIAFLLRHLTNVIGRRADKTNNPESLAALRRLETLIVLSIAIIRTLLVICAIYVWWGVANPGSGTQSSALLGASVILTIILTGALGPLLRDIANGSAMMAEHWYGVGDHIQADPIPDGQGIVERVTLRSTKIRGLNGEVIWINNQNIWAVHVTPKGLRTIAIELFVTDMEAGEKLIEDTNLRLPIGPLAVVSPLSIMTSAKIESNVWHITALAEVTPGRDWLIDKFALQIMKEVDKDGKVLVHEPISRFSDSEAERRFARTINNARKLNRKRVTRRESITARVAAHKRAVAKRQKQAKTESRP